MLSCATGMTLYLKSTICFRIRQFKKPFLDPSNDQSRIYSFLREGISYDGNFMFVVDKNSVRILTSLTVTEHRKVDRPLILNSFHIFLSLYSFSTIVTIQTSGMLSHYLSYAWMNSQASLCSAHRIHFGETELPAKCTCPSGSRIYLTRYNCNVLSLLIQNSANIPWIGVEQFILRVGIRLNLHHPTAEHL